MRLNGHSRSLSSFRMLAVALVIVAAGTTARGQDSGEVPKLKERIEQLEKDLKSAKRLNNSLERQVERLEKQVEQLESQLPESGEKQRAKKTSLSDLITADSVLVGEFKNGTGTETGKMKITIKEINGKKFKGTGSTNWENHPNWDLNHDIAGEIIEQNTLKMDRVGTAKKFPVEVTLKADGGLEGKWSNANGEAGTIGFTIKRSGSSVP